MKAARSFLMPAYRAATSLVTPLAPLWLNHRMRKGKEDAARLDERFGKASFTRPQGVLVWLHGASVGESLALMPLIENLVARDTRVLVTTGTMTSAAIMAARLPAGSAHQYMPLDAPRFVRAFLDHWRPDLALFAESELWPNFLHETHARAIPVALVNARLSQRSHDRWLKARDLVRGMLTRVDVCLAQTQEDARRFQRLGAPNVRVAGNLKFDAPAPPADALEVAKLRARIGSRPVWIAASTHPGEEEIVADAHARLLEVAPRLVTIIAPRHAERGAEVARAFEARGFVTVRRSQGATIDPKTQCYVADTMGEMGLVYRLASVVFLGRSLGAATGGQNPIEPAKLGAAVLHGPNVANFSEVYRTLKEAGGAREVANGAQLASALARLFQNPADLRQMAAAAETTVASGAGATKVILQAIEPYFMQMRVRSA